jgi:1-deoxy-D-xylulose-5-phosphate reductoisomerase
MSAKKRIAILGSTGSIGRQTLEVISEHTDVFEVELLAANNNADLLIQQAIATEPNFVVIANDEKYAFVRDALETYPIKVFAGMQSLIDLMESETIDIVVSAIVGFAGLQATLKAVENKKAIALANKETLVVAGEIIMQKALELKVPILPVDSEHSAIFQCIVGELHNEVEKIILTASGGPFRGLSHSELTQKTKADALQHPNWTMGHKITIDSASMMNKGLEVIEAHWLFGVPAKNIEVVVHPQSIIHSAVQFLDGSVKAQLGLPDMRLPIQYALSFPHRLPASFPKLSLFDYPNLTFEKPDTTVFRNLSLAYEALDKGGNTPCILNAANEIAVEAFLKETIRFTDLPNIIETTIGTISHIKKPTVDDLTETDTEARITAKNIINTKFKI